MLLLLVLFAADLPAAGATFDGLDAPGWIARYEEVKEAREDAATELRRKACYALGTIRPVAPQTVAALAGALRDLASEPRWYAADALARLGREALPAAADLAEALDPRSKNDATVHRLCARALGNLGPAAQAQLPALDALLNGDDAELRVVASLARWKITGDVTALRPLTEALTRGPPAVAFEAALALREIGPAARPAVGLLVQTLRHPDADVRRAAASTLAGLGSASLSPLAAALGQAEPNFDRVLAAEILGRIAAQLQRDTIARPGATDPERAAALAQCEREIAPPLAPLLGDPLPDVRAAAAHALAQVGPPALPLLMTALGEGSPAARAAAADGLRALEPRLQGALAEPYRTRAIPVATLLLRRTEPDLRRAAFRLFATLRVAAPAGEEARPLLRAALKDEDLAVRTYAVEALELLEQQ